jgi:hypothetical protein
MPHSGERRVDAVCAQCGVMFRARVRVKTKGHGRFCSLRCWGAYERGSNHPMWTGDRSPSNGYMRTTTEAGAREYRREHVVIAERALGKPLPARAVVHHFNDDGTDNANQNLVICQGQAYHMLLHALDRVRRAGGRPFLDRICHRCRCIKPCTEFSPSSERGQRCLASACKPCAAAAQRARTARRRHSVMAEAV